MTWHSCIVQIHLIPNAVQSLEYVCGLPPVWPVRRHVSAAARNANNAPWFGIIDTYWATICPLLPFLARTGRPRANDRETIDGILYVLTTGCRWQDNQDAEIGCWCEDIWHELASDLEQICKRLDRRAAPEAESDRADSLPASLTFLSFALVYCYVCGHLRLAVRQWVPPVIASSSRRADQDIEEGRQ